MAFQTQILENALKAAFDHGSSAGVSDPVQERAYQAKEIAKAIEAFVKTGTVQVTVTGASPSGTVTGTGTGNIT